jgi:PEP-CTERM motif
LNIISITNITKQKNLICLGTLGVIFTSLAASSHADVYVNQTGLPFIAPPTNTTFGVKYRPSNTSWDMSLGTTLDTATTATYVQAGLSNVAGFNNQFLNFTLEHFPAVGATTGGFIWSLVSPGATPTFNQTESWGTFATTPPGTNAATLQTSTTNTAQLAPTASFNTLKIEARGLDSGTSTGEMQFSNLQFTGTGLGSTIGVFDTSAANATTTGPTYFGQTSTVSEYAQWVYSTDNLAAKYWKLTGTIKTIKNYTTGDERVRFQISGLTGIAAPEPGTLGLLLLGVMGGALARRKKAVA